MNSRQRRVLKSPIYMGFESLHPRYGKIHKKGYSTVLTLNAGYE